MSNLDAYFESTMPDDERLTNYRAFSLGAAGSLSFFLARVASYCDLLEVELEDNSIAESYLAQSNASLNRAQSVLKHLKEILKPGSDDFEAFDLLLLTRGVASRLAKIGRAELNLQTPEQSPDDAFVRGRFFLLQQAFFELPHFFARSAEDSPTLNVWLTRQDMDEQYFRARKSPLAAETYFALHVSTATTEPDMESAICFTEKLVTSDALTLDDRLVFVSGIIMEHGGDLFVNADGDGIDRVTILLPIAENQLKMFGEKGIEEEDLRGDETILLVDDEGIVWDVVIDMLQGLGYTVILAENGKDCVEIYRDNPGMISLVLLDMVMPEMNGHDAFFELKKMDEDVKVLLQSGYIAQEEAQDVLDAGALGFLQKPYRMGQLAGKIREILG